MEWIETNLELPEYDRLLLLKYKKKDKTMIVSGYLNDVPQSLANSFKDTDSGNGTSTREFWESHYGDTFYDTLDRKLHDLSSKSKNTITHWKYLEDEL